ncbi:hypothetical protein M406DRAFT_71439 [Cryphonectria parasitica EP155]|uniref:Uncharacterized protein n=1 Tax=Cryphonectria parasitica (strain ATCC 38755 / EP155) TaxID=660469 RepID=A0A9P4Y7K4_CRYP1|nr:uncharacterized protein M406DRAFT_71439 [Cryphonectria parasitica EP155]KAF3768429.1 hypothetical protein M406DRAFT_71439 [Cryphonectria parasitica EP155]
MTMIAAGLDLNMRQPISNAVTGMFPVKGARTVLCKYPYNTYRYYQKVVFHGSEQPATEPCVMDLQNAVALESLDIRLQSGSEERQDNAGRPQIGVESVPDPSSVDTECSSSSQTAHTISADHPAHLGNYPSNWAYPIDTPWNSSAFVGSEFLGSMELSNDSTDLERAREAINPMALAEYDADIKVGSVIQW